MRLRGSVLIVVLGLLAVMAVVGIAFVTMSSIESNTAANFALQAQFDLAADGAVDYVCQALIRDVWEFDPANRTYSGNLLTGKYGTWPWDWPDPTAPTTTSTPTTPWPDAFLATNWSASTAPTTPTPAYSFRTDIALPAVTAPIVGPPFNLRTWGRSSNAPFTGSATTDGSPNNLGIPGGDVTKPSAVVWYAPQNGLWIPELAFPFGSGVVRTSVTVVDHAAMVNLNAHGTPGIAATDHGWIYSKAGGKGYFVCDVSPDAMFSTALATGKLLYSTTTTTPPGRWSITTPAPGNFTNAPGNFRLGEIFFQNPTIAQDRPFTLDDEFELRRLTGTYATSRLESLCGNGLARTPTDTSTTTLNVRMGLTTVGWNAEVMPGQLNSGGVPTKSDLNLANAESATCPTVLTALTGVLSNATTRGQFAANVCAFKERNNAATNSYFKQYGGYWGARRQAIMTKVKVGPGSSGWDVRVQLYNPWYGNYAGDTASNGAITVTGYTIKAYAGASLLKTYVIPVASIGHRQTWDTGTINVSGSLDRVTLDVTPGPGTIDQIISADLGNIGAGVVKKRPIGVYDEPRASDDTDASCKVTVLYVKKWTTGTDNFDTTPEGGIAAVASGGGVPIRFPHSVPYAKIANAPGWNNGPLPPYYAADATGGAIDTAAARGVFKAFLRVGDLNQVLCPQDADAASFWPWITKVAAQSDLFTGTPATDKDFEKLVKWDWLKDAAVIVRTQPVYDPLVAANNQYRSFNAANLFCVDSPWADNYDNDGDGKKDDLDIADTKANGRFCGREIRVAGRINLNTATTQALGALGLSLTGDAATYTGIATARPLTSPAEVLRTLTTASADAECLGPLEKRDFWYTRISNIATVRSDTFSVYGTVQFVYPPGLTSAGTPTNTRDLGVMKISRTRRFWALVDRSPSLNFAPNDASSRFIHPRIMNFQWID